MGTVEMAETVETAAMGLGMAQVYLTLQGTRPETRSRIPQYHPCHEGAFHILASPKRSPRNS